MTVYQASGCPRLVGLVGQLRQDIKRYVCLSIVIEHNIPCSMGRHQEIHTACLAGNAVAARHATATHLREMAAMCISELERKQGAQQPQRVERSYSRGRQARQTRADGPEVGIGRRS